MLSAREVGRCVKFLGYRAVVGVAVVSTSAMIS